MSRSRLDPGQIIQYLYDSATQSAKVSIQNLEMSVELSHNDGDSIYTYSNTVNGTATTGVAIPCDQYKKIAVYSTTPVGLLVEASPDNTTWVTIDNTNAVYIIKDLCAKYVRMSFSSGTVKYVLQS